jgi:hypothetical protein
MKSRLLRRVKEQMLTKIAKLAIKCKWWASRPGRAEQILLECSVQLDKDGGTQVVRFN